MIAEAYGIPNRRVTQLSELKGAIDELVKAPGAYFLEVDVLSEENVFSDGAGRRIAVGSDRQGT